MSAVDMMRDALYGNPPAADHKPDREAVLAAFKESYDRVTGLLNGIPTYANVAALPAVTVSNNGQQGRVISDPTDTNNTFWIVRAGVWVIDVLLADLDKFRAIFLQADETLVGGKILRLYDPNYRLIFDLDQNANIGARMLVKLALLAGSLSYDTLDATAQARLPFSLSDDALTGWIFRILNSDATRIIFGVPSNYPTSPMEAYVRRAAVADNALGAILVAANDAYMIEQFTDGSNVRQLRSRRRADNLATVLTTASKDSTGPQLLSNNMVIFNRDGVAYTVPAAGGTEAITLSDTSIALVSDSMGQGAVLTGLQTAYPTRAINPVSEGGEQTSGVAISFGVPRLTLAVAGNAIPTGGGVATCTVNYSFLNSGQCAKVEVTAVNGNKYLCTVYQASSQYYIKPVVDPGAGITLANPCNAGVVSYQGGGTDASALQSLESAYRGTLIMRHSTNSVGFDRGFVLGETLQWYRDIIALMRPLARQILIVGILPAPGNVPISLGGTSALSEANCKIGLDNTLALNAALKSEFPQAYLDPLANHKAISASNVSNFTVGGTVYEIANSNVIVDGTHENATGASNTVTMIQNAMTSKGY